MSAKSRLAQRFAAIIAIGIAFSWGLTAHGGAPGEKGAGKGSAPEAAKKSMQMRVFMPKHTDPAEVRRAIELMLQEVGNLEHPPMAGGGAGLFGMIGGQPGGPGARPAPGVPGVQPAPGGPGGLPGGAPGAGAPGGALGFQGGAGLGGFQGALGGAGMMGMVGVLPLAPPPLLVALDKRTGSVIVRGPEKEIEIAADLFKVLDNAPDKPLPEVKSLRALPLKHVLPSNIASLAGELDMGVALLALDDAKLLVAVGPPEAMRQVVELVSALDVAEEKRPNQKLKKLFGPDQQNKEAAAE